MRPALFAALALAAASAAAEPVAVELLSAGPDSPWRKVDPGWVRAADAALDPDRPGKLKPASPGDGPVWVNGDKGRLADLITRQSFGDCEAHVEFMLGKNSNSGIKFHAVYEIQFRDTASQPAEKLSGDSCGGVYPRAEIKGGKYGHIDKGIAPAVNAAKPAGEWQTLDVTFRAPRFDAGGKKAENARIVKAVLNGRVIHDDVELKTPTGTNWVRAETPTGPFMLQADHGPVAFRNVRVTPLK